MKRVYQLIFAVILLLFSLAINFGSFSFHGRPDGIYLLKSSDRKLFALKDRLRLDEYERLIARIEFEAFYERWRNQDNSATGTPFLKYNWNRKDGAGYLISFFPDGSRFLACLGRFLDTDINSVKGLFVGGGLPPGHYENPTLKTPETGVAFYDQRGWHHLWGRTAETISSPATATDPVSFSRWEFLGSEILFSSQYHLALKSSHLLRLGQQPLKVERYLNYHAKDRFFSLVNRFTNSGSLPLAYNYTYGNDPLNPHSGRTDRNGRQDLLNKVDLTNNQFIGLSGIQYAPDKEKTTAPASTANFLSWQGDALPDRGYLTSKPGLLLSGKDKVPLMNNSSRGVMLQWHHRTLLPGQSETMILTIGMAENDRQTLAPSSPTVTIDPAELRFLLSH